MESNKDQIMIVGTVIAVLFMVFIGIVIMGSLETSSNAEDSKSFRVDDITVNQNCDVNTDLDGLSVTVTYYDGITWTTLTKTTDYTVGAESVTVLATAMD